MADGEGMETRIFNKFRKGTENLWVTALVGDRYWGVKLRGRTSFIAGQRRKRPTVSIQNLIIAGSLRIGLTGNSWSTSSCNVPV